MEKDYSKVIKFLKSLKELTPFGSINYFEKDGYLWIEAIPPHLGALMQLLWSNSEKYCFYYEDNKIKVLSL